MVPALVRERSMHQIITLVEIQLQAEKSGLKERDMVLWEHKRSDPDVALGVEIRIDFLRKYSLGWELKDAQDLAEEVSEGKGKALQTGEGQYVQRPCCKRQLGRFMEPGQSGRPEWLGMWTGSWWGEQGGKGYILRLGTNHGEPCQPRYDFYFKLNSTKDAMERF